MTLDDHDEACPFCTGDVSPEIVEMIVAAADGLMSEPMTLEECRAWLDSLDPRM